MKNNCLLYIFILCLLGGMETMQAQSGAAALDKVVAKFQQTKGVSASFTLTALNALNEPMGKQSGTIKLSGDKFFWQTPDLIVWYNGSLQWAYMKATGEVNLTEPTPEEVAAINPYMLVSNYKQSYQVKALKAPSPQEVAVELTPKQKDSTIERIELTISRTTWAPTLFKLYYSDRSCQTIAVSKYTTEQNIPASTFVFDPKQYPEAELIDLR